VIVYNLLGFLSHIVDLMYTCCCAFSQNSSFFLRIGIFKM